MAQAHIHRVKGKTVVAEFPGRDVGPVMAMIESTLKGPSHVFNVVARGDKLVPIEKSDIARVTYTP